MTMKLPPLLKSRDTHLASGETPSNHHTLGDQEGQIPFLLVDSG